MKTKGESLVEMLAAVSAFFEGADTGTPDSLVNTAIRYAEHRRWVQEVQTKVVCHESETAVHKENRELMHSFHAARLETERQRQLAASEEASYWKTRAGELVKPSMQEKATASDELKERMMQVMMKVLDLHEEATKTYRLSDPATAARGLAKGQMEAYQEAARLIELAVEKDEKS